jgi:Sugar (and other) transporter
MSFLFQCFGDPLRKLSAFPSCTHLITVIRWVYLGESFPLRVRPKGIALGSATNWCVRFYMTQPVFRHKHSQPGYGISFFRSLLQR